MKLRSGNSVETNNGASNDTDSESTSRRRNVRSSNKDESKSETKARGFVDSSSGIHKDSHRSHQQVSSQIENQNEREQQPEQRHGVSDRSYIQNKPHKKYVISFLRLFFGGFLLLYLIVPITLRCNPWILSEIVFLNRVKFPFFLDLSKPADMGLNHTLHFKLPVSDDINLGVWHVLPHSYGEPNQIRTEDDFQTSLQGDTTVILYLHGNAGTRAGSHRVNLYRMFANMGLHVVAVDYRGFGDSSGSPTEQGCADDGLAVYWWIRKQNPKAKIIVWGHSLGSSIATNVVRQLCEAREEPAGLILEAPFNNIKDAATGHPLTAVFRLLPLFNFAFIEPLDHQNLFFKTDEYIADVKVQTLILHAEDDGIVPYKLGVKLYETAKKVKSKGGIQFKTFSASFGYGHKHLWKSPDLPDIVRDFEKNL